MSVGQRFPIQPGLEYNLKPEIIHKIVMLYYKLYANVIDIAWMTGIPDKEIINVINQERRNIAEAKDLSAMSRWRNWYSFVGKPHINIDVYKLQSAKMLYRQHCKLAKAGKIDRYTWREYVNRFIV